MEEKIPLCHIEGIKPCISAGKLLCYVQVHGQKDVWFPVKESWEEVAKILPK